jgi:hypothetical protein
MKALNILNEMAFERLCAISTMPKHCIPRPKFSDNSANNLTKAIIKYIELMGYQAERISNTGRYVDNTKKFKNIQGQQIQIGSGQYIPGTGTKGTADISSTIPININGKKIGVSVKWEVKFGKDRQSDFQKEYQKNIENSGGYYFIVHDFEDFMSKYLELTK